MSELTINELYQRLLAARIEISEAIKQLEEEDAELQIAKRVWDKYQLRDNMDGAPPG